MQNKTAIEQVKRGNEWRNTVDGSDDSASNGDSNDNIDCDLIAAKFEDMNLREELLRAIHAIGLSEPSVIQQRNVIPCIKGMDVILQSMSATDRTITIAIAILQRIDTSLNECQALILSPTQEFAKNVHECINRLAVQMDIKCNISIGGTNVHENVRELQNGVHIVVGTLGRVWDLLQRQALSIT